jgi:hypothetical protein
MKVSAPCRAVLVVSLHEMELEGKWRKFGCEIRDAAWPVCVYCGHNCNYMSTVFMSHIAATWSIRRHTHKPVGFEHRWSSSVEQRTSWETSSLLAGQKILYFYRTRRFNTVYITARRWNLSHMNPYYIIPPCLLEVGSTPKMHNTTN